MTLQAFSNPNFFFFSLRINTFFPYSDADSLLETFPPLEQQVPAPGISFQELLQRVKLNNGEAVTSTLKYGLAQYLR